MKVLYKGIVKDRMSYKRHFTRLYATQAKAQEQAEKLKSRTFKEQGYIVIMEEVVR